MWIGKIERMCIQSRVGEKWIEGKNEREREKEKMSMDVIVSEEERREERRYNKVSLDWRKEQP